jgi:pimeloyl-ACP methyl ester carboxylesterase
VLKFPGTAEILASQKQVVPALQGPILLPGCGHWTQQERPEAVNDAVLGFLRGL